MRGGSQRLLPPRPEGGPRFAWLAFLGDSIMRQEFEALARAAAAHPAAGAPRRASDWRIPYELKVFVCEGTEEDGGDDATADARPALLDFTCAPEFGLSAGEARSFVADRVQALGDRRVLIAITHDYARGPMLLPAAAGYPDVSSGQGWQGVLHFAERILAATNSSTGEPLPGAAVQPTALVFNPGLHALARNVSVADFALMLREMYLRLEAMLDTQRAPQTRLVQHNIGAVDNPRIDPAIEPYKLLLFKNENIVPLNAALAAEWRAHASRRGAAAAQLFDSYSFLSGGSEWSGPTWTVTKDGWHFDNVYALLATWVDLHLATKDGPGFSD